MPDLDDLLHAAAQRQTPDTLPDFEDLVHRRHRRDRSRRAAAGLSLVVVLVAGVLATLPPRTPASTSDRPEVLAQQPGDGRDATAVPAVLGTVDWTLLDVSADRRSATVQVGLGCRSSLERAHAYETPRGLEVQVVTRTLGSDGEGVDMEVVPECALSERLVPVTVALPRALGQGEELRAATTTERQDPEGYRLEQRAAAWTVTDVSDDRSRVTITVTLGGCLTAGYVTQGRGESGTRLDVTVFDLVPVLEGYGCGHAASSRRMTVLLARRLADGEQVQGGQVAERYPVPALGVGEPAEDPKYTRGLQQTAWELLSVAPSRRSVTIRVPLGSCEFFYDAVASSQDDGPNSSVGLKVTKVVRTPVTPGYGCNKSLKFHEATVPLPRPLVRGEEPLRA